MKTFKYNLTVPTSAPNIGLAIGPFDIHVDRAMPEMTHFCLHGLQKELKTTTAMTYQARDRRTDKWSCSDARIKLAGSDDRWTGETVRRSLYKAIVYYEELLSASFPFSLYKQVFVSKLPEKYKSYRWNKTCHFRSKMTKNFFEIDRTFFHFWRARSKVDGRKVWNWTVYKWMVIYITPQDGNGSE